PEALRRLHQLDGVVALGPFRQRPRGEDSRATLGGLLIGRAVPEHEGCRYQWPARHRDDEQVHSVGQLMPFERRKLVRPRGTGGRSFRDELGGGTLGGRRFGRRASFGHAAISSSSGTSGSSSGLLASSAG